MLLADIDARHVGLDDFGPDEFPFDPTGPRTSREARASASRRGSATWTGIDADPACTALATNALSDELAVVPPRVCGLDDLIEMKRRRGSRATSTISSASARVRRASPGRTRTSDQSIPFRPCRGSA
jgi:hypothetical protein